jgi:cytochrome b561
MIRLWHWSTFIVITGSLITVLFAKTILATKSNISMVQTNLQKNNVSVTSDQARSVAHDFNDMVWRWHIYIGYVLASLLLFRLICEFFMPGKQKLIPLIRKTISYVKMPDANKSHGRHYLFVKCAYLFFYLALFVQACSGLFMVYADDKPELKDVRHNVSDIHSVFMWIIIGYIVIHIIGVIRAEFSEKNNGIVSDMINGGE